MATEQRFNEKIGAMEEKGHGMVDKGTAAVREGAKKVSDTVSETMRSASERGSEMASRATEKATQAKEAVTRYLQEEDLKGMVQDVGEVVKRYPVPAMLVCFGIGLLSASFMRRR